MTGPFYALDAETWWNSHWYQREYWIACDGCL